MEQPPNRGFDPDLEPADADLPERVIVTEEVTISPTTGASGEPGAGTNIKDTVGNAAGQAGSTVGGAASKVASTAQKGASGVQTGVQTGVRGVRQGLSQVAATARRNPVGFGLGAVSLGFLAGLLLPSTRAESQNLSPVAQRIRSTAGQAVQGLSRAGQNVAQTARRYEQENKKPLASS